MKACAHSIKQAKPIHWIAGLVLLGQTASMPAVHAQSLKPYYDQLVKQRLMPAEGGSVQEYRAALTRAERAYADNDFDASAAILYELLESPYYADYDDLAEGEYAAFLMAGALKEEGALNLAETYALRVLKRGTQGSYFGPALRRFVDIALAHGDLEPSLAAFKALNIQTLPADAQSELAYLEGRSAYVQGNFAAAHSQWMKVAETNRFYVSARYMRGVMAVRTRNFKQAETLFCDVASPQAKKKHLLFADERYMDVRDLSRLALGRITHEQGRSDDAFYYYFQVPNDSERVAEAIFESAYAMYEGNDNDTAIDLLDQLKAKFPNSIYDDEARLLRAYVHIARCDFEPARKLFEGILSQYSPVLSETRQLLGQQSARQMLYEEVMRTSTFDLNKDKTARARIAKWLLLDPELKRIHDQLRVVDDELTRFASVSMSIDAQLAQLKQRGMPVRLSPATSEDVENINIVDVLTQLEQARDELAATDQALSDLRRSGETQLAPLYADRARLERKLTELETKTEQLSVRTSVAAQASGDLSQMLLAEKARAKALSANLLLLKSKLTTLANTLTKTRLVELETRLSSSLRKARIGQVDAVMGSKRRIERQIESLAAGRYPPEFQDPLRRQGLLKETEEYWPYDGEAWSDELDEPTSKKKTLGKVRYE